MIAAQILEKDDLVAKVQFLIENERRDRAREAEIHAMEEQAYLEQQRLMREEFLRQQAERERAQQQQRDERMSVDITPPTLATGIEEVGSPAYEHEEGNAPHDPEDHEHEHEGSDHGHDHLELPGDHPSVHSHTSTAAGAGAGAGLSSSPTPSSFSASVPAAGVPKSYGAPPATIERSGLCVICQDEEVRFIRVNISFKS